MVRAASFHHTHRTTWLCAGQRDVDLRKIEKGQFTLKDTWRQHDLDLARSWSALIGPGEHISMSMIIRRQQVSKGICPSCGEKNDEDEAEEVAW